MHNDNGFIPLPAEIASRRHWDASTRGRRTFGVCVPVWSLNSPRSAGMGDLADLKAFIDLLADTGTGLIQVLPMNDAGLDGVPYSALSAFALDPAYVALDDIDGLNDPAFDERLRETASRFAGADRVDNVAVRSARLSLLREAFEILESSGAAPNLDVFLTNNPWVDVYASFKVLKGRAGNTSWEAWHDPSGPSVREVVDSLRSDADFRFHVFGQWLMDRQMTRVHAHARDRGVLIEGDIPILVARDSADVWALPELFHLEFAAGAPPDMYSEDGQHWGFPTYRWDVAEATGYDWWKRRLAHAARYYDLYRIDHVVGFFRIWTVDVNAPNGREGWFDPSDEHIWGEHGRRILQMMLDACGMLPLAEDLGTIPPVCRSTLREMGICGLKVQRWEKNWNTDGRFILPDDYEPLSVATFSTHDCEIAAEWWAATAPADRVELWSLMQREGDPPPELNGADALSYLIWFADVRSAFVVHSLQDVMQPLGLLPGPVSTHRVNLPGTVGPHNWSWICPLSTPDLAGTPEFVDTLRKLAALTAG